MDTVSQMKTRERVSFILIAWMFIFPFGMGHAQLIPLKTIPVATGDQFLIHSSQNMSMAGVHIGLRDSLLDHWVNPALGSALSGALISTSPAYYHVGNGYGHARSMTMSLTWSEAQWFGGGSLALQAMSLAESQGFWGPDVRTLSSDLSQNQYLAGFAGKRFGTFSLGVGASYAYLNALDGVDLLYANSERIEQKGSIRDLRLGLSQTGVSGASREVMLIYNELDMLHEVTYRTGGWEGFVEQLEKNLDHTITWGFHSAFKKPLQTPRWTYGGLFTVNYKSHPKIPNYEIMNIPRDPGSTLATNIGFGIAKQDQNSTFSIEMVYEPIRSNTWAVADTFMIDAEDHLIRPGDKTIENEFDFSNMVLRTGLGWKGQQKTFQFGIQMRNIHYWLDQVDHLAVTQRDQEEYWVEWTTTWGLTFTFSDFNVRYSGKTTMGTGRPGVDTQIRWFGGMEDVSTSADFIIAPSAALTLQEARVMTHQITLSMPIGG